MSPVVSTRFLMRSLAAFLIFSSSLAAQTPDSAPSAIPAGAPQHSTPEGTTGKLTDLSRDDFLTKGIVRQILRDQKSIWTSPARVKPSDARWLLPLAGTTAFLFTRDNEISHRFDRSPSLQNTSLKISDAGAIATYTVPGAFLGVGKLMGNERLSDAGQHGFQAALYSAIAMEALKLATDRTRPYLGGTGSFWTGGNSFPSGHAMEAWALAEVISDEYRGKPLIRIGMYSFATAVGVSRITSRRHYASDVLVGSAVGYLIGRFVMRHHLELH